MPISFSSPQGRATRTRAGRSRCSSSKRVRPVSRWASLIDQKPHNELAETILEESGYVDMWRADRTAEAAGRLENLKEFVRAMEGGDAAQSTEVPRAGV